VQSKLTKIISRRPQDDLVEKPFYRIGIDLIQLLPHGQSCLNSDKYAGHAVCQCTRWHEVDTFSNRNQSILSRWLSRLLRKIQRVFDRDVTAIRSDNEKGYGNYVRDLCLDLGIRLELRAEHHEEQNGFTENAGKQLIERSRSMRLQANLPGHLSHELVRTVAYILNRTSLDTNK
jgi:hypothetical protein